jgi:hypothetical protein
MTNFNEDYSFELENEEIFNEFYEIEGAKKIKELSRQLRTFFNYKAETIRVRFQPRSNITYNYADTKFLVQKQKIEILTNEFVLFLKNLKNKHQNIEEGIRFLLFENDKTQYHKLLETIEKLSDLIHLFSEQKINNHPRLLKFIVVLAENICNVKKFLNVQFKEFYDELRINYYALEIELESLLEQTLIMKDKKLEKQYGEKLKS